MGKAPKPLPGRNLSAPDATNDSGDVPGAGANALDALERELDDLVIRMRSPEQVAATERLFRESDMEFGQATAETDQR